ncbi:MAG: DegT/DnrJ/EryC1/StrS family aminotransferase, partial [Fibrobacterota bacterium]
RLHGGDLEALAAKTGVALLEDSTESVGSSWNGRIVGSFGRASLFDFSHPSVIACGQGGMIATDDDLMAAKLRHLRGRLPDERGSLVSTSVPSMHAGMGEISAALGVAQLARLEGILLRRQHTERLFRKHIRSFEGIKDPYLAPNATEVHWLMYVVHLGKRFTRSSRDAIVEDLRASGIEAAVYSHPMHTQRYFVDKGCRRADLPTTERISDRAVALPLHRNISEEQIAFIVSTMKDASINVGAGAAIY